MTDTTPAPIALFVYRRLDHTRLTVEALRDNDLAARSRLYVFCDGPRSEEEAGSVAAVRDFAHGISGFESVEVVERGENMGLARSIIAGVTQVVAAHGRVIVVEDDLVTSPFFLRYMNDGLTTYRHDDRVASIHGYIYPVARPLPETFFLRGADCWGWATWDRAWTHFEPDADVLLKQLKERGLEHAFDLDGSYGFTEMLRAYARGSNNSWAIRWHASMFLRGMLTLYPGESMVNNIGLDSSGTHCTTTSEYLVHVRDTPIKVGEISVEQNVEARQAVVEFFLGQR